MKPGGMVRSSLPTSGASPAVTRPGTFEPIWVNERIVEVPYALGVLAELATLTDRTVFVHGMMLPMIEAYREVMRMGS